MFTSSIAVYGAGQLPMSEDMTPRPRIRTGSPSTPSSSTCGRRRGCSASTTRSSGRTTSTASARTSPTRYRNVIGIFMNSVLRDEPMTVFGDGLQTRAFSHIDDVAPVIAGRRWSRPPANEVFNVGADQPYTILELAADDR